MVDQDDRNSPSHLRVLEDRPQGPDLLTAQAARGDERRPRNGAREPDDGRRSPQADERVDTRAHADAEVREVAPHERAEVAREPAFATDRGKVEVVIAG